MKRQTARSGNNLLHDATTDIGQSEIASRVTVGELSVIEAHQIEDRGVEIVDVNQILSDR